MNDAGGGSARSMFHPPHLGELIRESMDEVGWNVTETAARLGCERGTLSRVLSGKAGVSANMALALEGLGWGTAEHWMRMQASCIVSCLKRFGADSLEGSGGVSGIDIEPAARDLVNDLERYPHAFVLACVADRQTKADIAWSLPHAIRETAGGFDIDTLLGLEKDTWTSVLASSGHRLASQMEQLLPAALRHIRNRYGGNASRIWAGGSSGAAVARRFLAVDGVGPKIANMAVNILIRDFGIRLARPMPDIAVDTHVLRVFERLGLLSRLEHSQLRWTKDKQALRLQLRARELNPKWPGELDWPAWMIGKTWCHAGRAPECYACCMGSVCPKDGVASNSAAGS